LLAQVAGTICPVLSCLQITLEIDRQKLLLVRHTSAASVVARPAQHSYGQSGNQNINHRRALRTRCSV